MSDNLISSMVTVGVAIVGLATLAVIVSNNSNTAGVVTSAGNAFSSAIRAAVSPVAGGFGGFTGGGNINTGW